MALGKLHAGLARMHANVEKLNLEYNQDIDSMIIDAAVKGEEYMKENAPWEDNDGNRNDRTPGEARDSLFTVPDVAGDHKEILFSHGVNYGIWLEANYSGRYEIVMPAVKAIGDQLMQSTEGSLNMHRRRLVGSPADVVAAEQAARKAQAKR